MPTQESFRSQNHSHIQNSFLLAKIGILLILFCSIFSLNSCISMLLLQNDFDSSDTAISTSNDASSDSSKIPSWYADTYSVYPTEKFFTAEGSGFSVAESHESALSQLTLQFDAKTQTQNNLSVSMQEVKSKAEKIYARDVFISQQVSTSGNAKLLGVSFAQDFSKDGLYHSLAVMNIEKCLSLYNTKISQNNAQIQSCLNKTSQKDNPLLVYAQSVKALNLAYENSELVSVANVLINEGNSSSSAVSSCKKFCENANSLFANSVKIFEQNENLRFVSLSVSGNIEGSNDIYGSIERSVKEQLEKCGFFVSKSVFVENGAVENFNLDEIESEQDLENAMTGRSNATDENSATSVDSKSGGKSSASENATGKNLDGNAKFNDGTTKFICIVTDDVAESVLTGDTSEFFCTPALEIRCENPFGKTLFTYSRSFGKKGGLSREQAIKRSHQDVVKEINATFANELKEKIGL